MAVGRACRLRGLLRLLDRTGIFIVEIRYFSVNSDGIRELTCKVKAELSYSTPIPTPLGLGKLTQLGGETVFFWRAHGSMHGCEARTYFSSEE